MQFANDFTDDSSKLVSCIQKAGQEAGAGLDIASFKKLAGAGGLVCQA